ncbi:MAG TPA: YHYH protein [Candidatus Saccharimonadales bacterium]|nr:YHYH protein [Candidatus Saccharimonadales bacterium]
MKKKAINKKNSSKLQKVLQIHFTYITLAVFLFITVVSVVSTGDITPSHAVLGTATQTTQQEGFSLSNFFSSFFSLFSRKNNAVLRTNHSLNTTITTIPVVTPTMFTPSQQATLTQDQLLAMADNTYADGNLPLGDNNYVTDTPKKGYIYLCHVQMGKSGGGAGVDGPWIKGNTWNIKEKTAVAGKVSWSTAIFSNTTSGSSRVLSGNDLPSHTTGVFPIQSSDQAYSYDRNPNTISPQSFSDTFPLSPTYSNTPSCMGGEVGIMLTGVALFNGFDAEYRDAAAHELQDSCSGHPEKTGEYHYHSLSNCITDVNETTIIGYALDGFPITGSKVATDKYLTTNDLDECHGITSAIIFNGKSTVTYHYVMTQDFPYSVSCFRGKPVTMQVIANSQGTGQQNGAQGMQTNTQQMSGQGIQQNAQSGMHQPPQEAITACSGKTSGSSCSFSGLNGIMYGICQTPPNQNSLACIPNHPVR